MIAAIVGSQRAGENSSSIRRRPTAPRSVRKRRRRRAPRAPRATPPRPRRRSRHRPPWQPRCRHRRRPAGYRTPCTGAPCKRTCRASMACPRAASARCPSRQGSCAPRRGSKRAPPAHPADPRRRAADDHQADRSSRPLRKPLEHGRDTLQVGRGGWRADPPKRHLFGLLVPAKRGGDGVDQGRHYRHVPVVGGEVLSQNLVAGDHMLRPLCEPANLAGNRLEGA